MTIRRTPLYFGPEDRSLFGWLHAPESAAQRDLAVVLCPPVGHEYINSHRSIRHLADRLAEAGIPALRFDYDGTGDSCGDDEDPARLAAWRSSVAEAMRTAREITGCTRLGLAGVRLGAALAVAAATEAEVDFLVLWAPVVRGRAYNRELKALHLTGGNRVVAIPESGQLEPAGFVVTAETQRDLAGIVLEELLPKTRRVLIVARDDLAADPRLRDVWREAGIDTEQWSRPGYAEMFASPHNTVVPDAVIGEIVDWIATGAPPGPVASLPSPLRAEQRSGELRESFVRFDAAGSRVFGILTESESVTGEAPLILLPNAGSSHHAGPNRLYVQLARALGAAGFRALRFDLPGLGDSILEPPAGENDSYFPATSSVIGTAIEILRNDRRAASFVLMGLCSGAHASFHAALDLPGAAIAESVLINPLTFYYKPGMPLDSPMTGYREWRWYMRSVRRFDRWRKLLRGEARLSSIARAIYRRLLDKLAIHASALTSRLPFVRAAATLPEDLGHDLRRIVRSGRKVTFVFSRFAPGYDLLMDRAGPAVQRYRKRGVIQLWRIDGATHTFEAKQARDTMIAELVAHLRKRYLR
jgi:alpha-beta hydrolase superfamily lysophospholipase